MASRIDPRAAAQAWREIKAFATIPVIASGHVDDLDEYFKALVPSACPEPAYYGSDELKCLKCGRIWDAHEDRPDCGVS